MRLTIACPIAHAINGNHLAMALGYGPADGLTYSHAGYQDAAGNRYACASLPVGDVFVTAATSPLVRPAWDNDEIVDLAKATAAQAIVRLWVPSEDRPTPPLALPGYITAVAGEDGPAMLAAMGLFPVPMEANP